ncbi:MAG: response regulator [Tissierellia bacterium]|nr:response regulator [Tissierellia bacterium]
MFKLMIADDESIIRRGIKKLVNLSELNIDSILEADNGNDAIKIALSERPDIILMDINMPGTDGLTAASEIKNEFKNAFIIILTGYDYFEYTQAAIRAKVDDYVLKPVSKVDIEYILKTAIDKIINDRKEKSLSRVIDEGNGNPEIFEQSDAIRKYISDNIFSFDFSLSKMAEEVGYNSNYLSVLFKQIFAMPFQDYTNKKRMEKAKLLLLSTEMKNYEIADAIGMEDVNYFVTKFKKYFNVTPKQFRQGAINEKTF